MIKWKGSPMLYPPSMNRIHSYELFSYLLRFLSDIKLHCFSLKKEAAVSSVKQHCNTKATVCVQHTQSDTAVSLYTGFLFCFAHFTSQLQRRGPRLYGNVALTMAVTRTLPLLGCQSQLLSSPHPQSFPCLSD